MDIEWISIFTWHTINDCNIVELEYAGTVHRSLMKKKIIKKWHDMHAIIIVPYEYHMQYVHISFIFSSVYR